MRKLVLISLSLAVLGLVGCGPSRTYVLVHGAFSNKAAWDKVVPLLQKSGATVTAVELPAHGGDQTAVSEATLQAYTDKVVAAIDAQKQPVILVGHSMGGTVISQAAEARPEKVQKLVYLAAYLLKNGESLYGLAQTDGDSLLGQSLVPAENGATLSIKPEAVKPSFCAECSDADAATLSAGPEPTQPLGTPIAVTDAKWGSVPRFYIRTTQDRAVSPALQQRMLDATPVEKVFTIESGHAPYLSKASELATILQGL
jgi:pimeloyl-ACP methyl ester carboxylesterase